MFHYNNLNNSATKDYRSALYSSPGVPLAKYECSPIVSIEKYKLNMRISQDGIVSGTKNNISHLINFNNQSTPVFKKETNEKELIKGQSTASYSNKCNVVSAVINNKIKIPLNLSTCNSLIGNYIEKNLNGCNNGVSYLPNVFTSLKRLDKDSVFLNYLQKEKHGNKIICNINDKNNEKIQLQSNLIKINETQTREKFLSKKTKAPCRRNSIEHYITKNFSLDEIILEGKKINFLLNENIFQSKENKEANMKNIKITEDYQTSSYDLLIIKPFYENNFKRLNTMTNCNDEGSPFSLKLIQVPKLKEKNESKKNKDIITKLNSTVYLAPYKKIFTRQFKKAFDLLSYNNLLEPIEIFKEKAENFKDLFNKLQDDYICRSKKVLNKNLLLEVNKKMKDINLLCDILVDCLSEYNKKFSKNNNKKIKIQYQDDYDCKICFRKFQTGQGLGGHMSRMHPNCSEQYKSKMKIRRSRDRQRAILLEAKKKILSDNGHDYSKLKEAGEKKLIKKILFQNKKEFKAILSLLKKEKHKK
jgi:hypothetical protein